MRHKQDDWTALSDLEGFVRLVLLVDWDPIRVFGYAGAMDEYDSYAAAICDLLRSGASPDKIVEHLQAVEQQQMRIFRGPQVLRDVARKLLMAYSDVG